MGTEPDGNRYNVASPGSIVATRLRELEVLTG